MESGTPYQYFNTRGLKSDVKKFKEEVRKYGWSISEPQSEEILQLFLFSFIFYNKNNIQWDSKIRTPKGLRMNLSSEVLRNIFNDLGFNYKVIRDSLVEIGFLKVLRRGYYDKVRRKGIAGAFCLKSKTFFPKGKKPNRYIAKMYREAKNRKTQLSIDVINAQAHVLNDPYSQISIPGHLWDHLEDYQKKAVNRINEGNLYFDDFGEKQGRIYHPYQNLPKWVRDYTSIDGEKVVEADLKNSQAHVLFLMVREDHMGSFRPIPKDLQKGFELSQKGIIYEHIAYITGSFRDDRSLDRDRGKDLFNLAVFGRTVESGKDLRRLYRYQCNRIRKEFPTVFKFLDRIKKSNYKDASNLITRREGKIVGGIESQLLEEEIPFINIHDAFLVREKDLGTVKKMMLDKGFSVNEPQEKYYPVNWVERSPGDLDHQRRAKLFKLLMKKGVVMTDQQFFRKHLPQAEERFYNEKDLSFS